MHGPRRRSAGMQQPGYDFFSEENSSKWRGLFVQALKKVRVLIKMPINTALVLIHSEYGLESEATIEQHTAVYSALPFNKKGVY